MDLVARELDGMRKDHKRLSDELAAIAQIAPADIDQEAEALVDRLWSLEKEINSVEPSRLREVFKRMLVRVDLWFEQTMEGEKSAYH